MTPIQTNKPVFFDDEGSALEGGQIYIGQPNTDPRTNPKTVTFRDSGGSEFTASQPLKTVAGRISYNGKPIVALVDGEYSMLILDAAGKQLDYSRSINEDGVSGGSAGLSDVMRVGLTLNEVKAFNVSVGDTCENIGRLTATAFDGDKWLTISSTGSPGNDIDLIDFDNGLQGSRIGGSAAANYKDYGTFEMGGAFDPGTLVRIIKVGSIVRISSIGGNIGSSLSVTSARSDPFIPAELRPSDLRTLYGALDTTTSDIGVIQIQVSSVGDLNFIVRRFSGSAGAISNWGTFDISYII